MARSFLPLVRLTFSCHRRGNGSESFSNEAELAEDTRLGVGWEGRVRAGDKLGQHRNERGILVRQPDGLGAGCVDHPDAVVGEVPCLALSVVLCCSYSHELSRWRRKLLGGLT